MIEMNHNRRDFVQATAYGMIGLPLAADLTNNVKQTSSGFVSEFAPSWQRTHAYTLEVAEAMPEVDYDFRPTSNVYSFAQQMIHVQITNRGFLAVIEGSGAQPTVQPRRDGRSKVDIVTALDRSFVTVQDAIRTVSEDVLDEVVPWGGRLYQLTEMSKRQVVDVMRNHLTHHRAQAVVYLRMRGVVPPPYVD